MNSLNQFNRGAAWGTGGLVFAAFFIVGILFYRAGSLPLGWVEILSIFHAAMGMGFFAGFVALLAFPKRDK